MPEAPPFSIAIRADAAQQKGGDSSQETIIRETVTASRIEYLDLLQGTRGSSQSTTSSSGTLMGEEPGCASYQGGY